MRIYGNWQWHREEDNDGGKKMEIGENEGIIYSCLALPGVKSRTLLLAKGMRAKALRVFGSGIH